MRKPPSSFTSLFLIMLLLTGTIPTLTSLSLIDTEAFSDKKEREQHIEENDYQKKYKQHDFEKYLSHQYEIYKEYTDYYDDLLNSVENPKKKSSTLSENINWNLDDKKLDQVTTDNNDKRKYVLEYDGKQSMATDDNKIDSSSDKSEKKNYKDIKILKCSNSNINAYEVEDPRDVETILNQVIISQQYDDDDKQNDLQINNNNNNNNNNKEIQEYNIGKETKVIFICDNKNQKNIITSLPDEDSNMINSLPDEGILLP
jgi:hypothetical protein